MKLKNVGLSIFSAFMFLFMITTVSASSVNSEMTQEEINAAISDKDVVDVLAGDYATIASDGRNYHKYILADGIEITVNLNGSYDRLQLITKNNGTIHVVVKGNTTLNGESSSVYNPVAAIAIQSGLVDINTSGNTLTISDYNNGIRLGNNIKETQTETARLTLLENAKVVITSSYSVGKAITLTEEVAYYDSYNDFGDPGVAYGWKDNGEYRVEGQVGSAIYTRGIGATHYITLEKGSLLDTSNNGLSGIYVGYGSSANNVYINLTDATLTGNNNGGVGLFEDGNATGNYHLTATNSNISFSNNGSNGMTGHSLSEITLINSTLHADNNKSIGINNALIKLSDNSLLTGNNNGSHGITNVSLDAYDSTVEANNNTYIGLNITKYNETSTNIVNSKITAKANKGPGIRFHAMIKVDDVYEGTTNITDGSVITALGNGIGTSIYGYKVKPNDSGSWADIVASGTVNTTESSVFCGTYSLYNRGRESLSSILYVNKDMIVTVDKNDEFANALEIFNDKASTATGRTYVISGSVQGNLLEMTNGESYTLNGVVVIGDKDDIYAAPINTDGTKLLRFDLNQEINVEVNSDGTNTFTYYDPYTGKEYVYQFRYNELGEDLVEGESNNAYIWTPASIVHYDSTEGLVDYKNSTAGEIVNGSSKTNQENNGKEDRYTHDITVFGNSLDLAEKYMPSAVRDGYVFLGWFAPDYENTALAKELAIKGEFAALYALLNNPFTQSTKVLSDFNDPTTGLEEITIYAKWGKLGTVIVHYVDEDGNKLGSDIITTDIVGNKYTTTKLEFDGYTFKTVTGNTTGTYIDGTIEVTYIYEFTSGIGDGGDIDVPSTPGEILPPQTGLLDYFSNNNNGEAVDYTNISSLSSLVGIISLLGLVRLRRN